MKAVRANKEYYIEEEQKATYLATGFDIVLDDGTIEYSPQSKVSFGEHKKVLDENKALEAELESLKEALEALKADLKGESEPTAKKGK